MQDFGRIMGDRGFELAGSMRPSAPSTGHSRVPPVKYSGAPHSSSIACASRWQKATPPGLLASVNDSELAAVPVPTKNTATSRSKISLNLSLTALSRSPLP